MVSSGGQILRNHLLNKSSKFVWQRELLVCYTVVAIGTKKTDQYSKNLSIEENRNRKTKTKTQIKSIDESGNLMTGAFMLSDIISCFDVYGRHLRNFLSSPPSPLPGKSGINWMTDWITQQSKQTPSHHE